jgi:uncharacterized protein YunC (DUF1805 family)
MVKIVLQPVSVEGGSATGLSVSWDSGQLVLIVAEKGLIACGAFDVKVMDEFDTTVSIARGKPSSPLKTPDDLLAAKIVDSTSRAKKIGILPRIDGKRELEILLGE